MTAWITERNRLREADKASALPDATGGGAAQTTPTTAATPAQKASDDFEKTNATEYAGGVDGWIKERNRLREAARTEKAGTASTTVTGADSIPSANVNSPLINGLVEDLIKNGMTFSPEEEASIRRQYADVTRKVLSSFSGKGLGRSSEAMIAELQGAFAAEGAVGEAKARVRQQGTENAIKAAGLIQQANELNLNKTTADRNYQLVKAGQNLEALKNEQGVGFQERAMQLKKMETKAGIKQMQQEFGLKLNENEWKKFKEGQQLTLQAIDLDQTRTLSETKMVNDFMLASNDQRITETLGLSRLEVEKAIEEHKINIDKVQLAMERMFKNLDVAVERDKIRAALIAADQSGDLFAKFIGILGTAAAFI